MFVNSEHLPQRLQPEHYTSPEIYQQEIEKLFLPGWHCLGVVAQMPEIGDFCTVQLFERPLICWHTAEGFRTYLNVCSHRFSKLTNEKQGHAKGTLKCQYHGWEFDQAGNTCKIPDAQCFRPLTKGQLGLKEYRTETVGQLIFVCLDESSPSLRDFLGAELVALCEDWFGPDSRIVYVFDQDLECNWKVVAENVVESYHIESVHSKSFVNFPRAEECTHAFHATYDHFIHDYRNAATKSSTRAERTVARLTGQAAELRYHNLMRYPNINFGKGAQVGYIQMIWPVSPSKCHTFSLFMDQPGRRGCWQSELAHRLIKFAGAPFIRRVLLEDAVIYPHVHQGIACPDRPHGGGLISTREERVFAFQDYILEAMEERTSKRTAMIASLPDDRLAARNIANAVELI